MKNLPVIAVLSAACLLAACEQPKDSKGEATQDSTDTMVVPPMIAADAPSEPSMGEPASASQPQPVYPSDAMKAEPEKPSVTDEPAADEVMEKGREEIIMNPPTVSNEAPSEPSMGEPASASQPQPVYPDTAASDMVEAEAADEMIDETTNESSSSQPQPVYPDGKPDGM
jgi:hypothetical protein